MTDWLERAKREIFKSVDRDTDNNAERNPSSVTAVPFPAKSEIAAQSIGSNGSALVAQERTKIEQWLARIQETDPAVVDHVLNKCEIDIGARQYFLWQADEVPQIVPFHDDRRRCDDCTNFASNGLCLAAWAGEITASKHYKPVRTILRRCEGYMPKATEIDQRTGGERWPFLMQKGDDDGIK